jgi:signal transduction histidine kinase
VLLAAFTVLAAVLAWRLTRGPARRIAGIAELAGEISEQDLSRRLDLPGPRDEITDLADRFDTMLARLQSAFADRERFVANASHELRTPITATRAALEAPLTQGRVPAELEPYLRRALRANQRMEELITALLSIARTRHLHAGDLQDLALGALVTEAVDGIRDRAGARGIAVVLDLPATAVLVRGHRASLMIALGNLLDNAVRHNRDGGRVRVGVTQGRGRAAVLVANTGPTYSAAEAHELLQPFSRGQHTRRAGTPGTGLGLSVVTSIAAAQDGTVEVSPGAEDGLSVSLTLPLAPRGGRERGRDPRRAEVTAPDEARRR